MRVQVFISAADPDAGGIEHTSVAHFPGLLETQQWRGLWPLAHIFPKRYKQVIHRQGGLDVFFCLVGYKAIKNSLSA